MAPFGRHLSRDWGEYYGRRGYKLPWIHNKYGFYKSFGRSVEWHRKQVAKGFLRGRAERRKLFDDPDLWLSKLPKDLMLLIENLHP